MRLSKFGICAAVVLCAFSSSGCKEKYPVASPACVEMNETKDPVRKAELEKYCPTGGEYKPSPVVNW